MNEGDVLLKLSYSNGYISFHTYERELGGRGRFLIATPLLLKAIMGIDGTTYLDTDCGNYVDFRKDGEYLKFSFLWLRQMAGRFYSGQKQHIAVPIMYLMKAIAPEHEARTILCRIPNQSARIDASRAVRTLRRILPDKRKRRAFSKAMRDCFQWNGDEVYLSDDGGCNFFFTTKSGFPSCGGLILHSGTKNGKHRIYYSVHT